MKRNVFVTEETVICTTVFEHGFSGLAAEVYLDCLTKKSKDFENRNKEADFREDNYRYLLRFRSVVPRLF